MIVKTIETVVIILIQKLGICPEFKAGGKIKPEAYWYMLRILF
jgi:hypothetical protein